MIDMLGCGDPRENVTQTVTLSKLAGTMGADHGWTFGESLIVPVTAVRVLGAVFDTHMTMTPPP